MKVSLTEIKQIFDKAIFILPIRSDENVVDISPCSLIENKFQIYLKQIAVMKRQTYI